MTAPVAFFLFGLAAGFVMIRLARKKSRGDREWRLLVAAGYLLASAALALAAVLFGYVLLGLIRG